MRFEFKNPIPSSKSIYNRLLICKSYFPSLHLVAHSTCEDVVLLKDAISNLTQQKFFVGDGGTSFRFLALRLSRFPGKHYIEIGNGLQNRPHEDLLHLLDQLKVSYQFSGNVLELEGKPWYLEKDIHVEKSVSSQFLTSLLLNAWLLDKDLKIQTNGKGLSESYVSMTKKILNDLGMQIEWRDDLIRVPAKQSLKVDHYQCEIDMSSAFVIAALGAITGGLRISTFSQPSLQGDVAFVDVLQKMGVETKLHKDTLQVLPNTRWKALEYNLKNTPDLFPVLAVLCSFAEGSSKLFGAPHLKHKESNRIETVAALLTAMKIRYEKLEDGMIIHGNPKVALEQPVNISTYNDHRIAFAAAVAKIYGYPLFIEGKDCVNKSFPEFWSYFPANFTSEIQS
jgi:3-phosphoshikimate 1-carboxyvinyltransferase